MLVNFPRQENLEGTWFYSHTYGTSELPDPLTPIIYAWIKKSRIFSFLLLPFKFYKKYGYFRRLSHQLHTFSKKSSFHRQNPKVKKNGILNDGFLWVTRRYYWLLLLLELLLTKARFNCEKLRRFVIGRCRLQYRSKTTIRWITCNKNIFDSLQFMYTKIFFEKPWKKFETIIFTFLLIPFAVELVNYLKRKAFLKILKKSKSATFSIEKGDSLISNHFPKTAPWIINTFGHKRYQKKREGVGYNLR